MVTAGTVKISNPLSQLPWQHPDICRQEMLSANTNSMGSNLRQVCSNEPKHLLQFPTNSSTFTQKHSKENYQSGIAPKQLHPFHIFPGEQDHENYGFLFPVKENFKVQMFTQYAKNHSLIEALQVGNVTNDYIGGQTPCSGTGPARCQFHKHFTSNFFEQRSQKRKKTLMT